VELLVLLLVVSDLDAALQDIGERGPSGGEVVKDLGLFVEDDMEVPASTERADGGFYAEALPGNDLDPDMAVGTIWIGGGDTGSIELLIRRFDHLVLDCELVESQEMDEDCTYFLREVDPEL
jgi:hypothetical protein